MEQQKTTTETVAEPQKKSMVAWKSWMTTKTAIIVFCVLLVIGLAYYFRSLYVAATVNGHIISRMEVIHKLEQNSGGQMLDSLITEELIKEEAKKKGITVTNDEVNAEITKLETQFKDQGTTLDDALATSNMSRANLKEQVLMQKQVEKLLGNDVNVTDAEVADYIKTNKITIPKGQEQSAKDQIAEQLKSDKINTKLDALITTLKGQAKIKHYVNY